jgi:8-amino-7-oxononanoate synthase
MFDARHLDDLKKQSRYRVLSPLSSPQGPQIELNGKNYLHFSSNDYLGLASHPDLIQTAKFAAEEWGTGSGASRLISGSLKVHHDLEQEIASFKAEDAAMIFSSGFQANLSVLPALLNPQDTVWLDRYCHASLIDSARLSKASLRVFPHRDYDRLEALLKKSSSRQNIIVTDTYFSMDGDVADLPRLLTLSGLTGAKLMVDEAHANGVFGARGGGLTEDFGVQNQIDIVTGTFSKSFGSQGGFITGKHDLIELLVNTSRGFIYSTAPSPIISAISLRAVEIVKSHPELRQTLWQRVNLLRKSLEDKEFNLMNSTGPIVPILVGNSEEALAISHKLMEEGIYLPAIRPPTVPEGTDRLRITITAKHSESEIERLLKALIRSWHAVHKS